MAATNSVARSRKRLLAILSTLAVLLTTAAGYAGTYTSSQHGSTTTGVTRQTIDNKYAVFGKGNCAHCHEQHVSLAGVEPTDQYGTSGPKPALQFSKEEYLCETCHDGDPVTRSVQAQVNKTYKHPIDDSGMEGRHTLGKLEKSESGAPFRGTRRHVECADCHEPHSIGAPGTTLHSYNTTTPANNNLVSNPILGVWGVEPASEPTWLAANVTFNVQNPSTKEYQICLKCHSYYAFQDADGVTTVTPGPSGQIVTDQGMEFSINNKSVHPVRVGLNSQTGSSATKKLSTAQMRAPWNDASRIGVQTMYCSDCHGNDANAASDARGPHGSGAKYMLKKSNIDATWNYNTNEWPINSTTSKLWTLKDVMSGGTANWNQKLLCAKCHMVYGSGSYTSWYNDVHKEHEDRDFNGNPWQSAYPNNGQIPCVSCHIAVPHGSKGGRLMGKKTWASPYTVTEGTSTFPVLDGFKKSSLGNYNKDNCWITTACGSHGNNGPYDF